MLLCPGRGHCAQHQPPVPPARGWAPRRCSGRAGRAASGLPGESSHTPAPSMVTTVCAAHLPARSPEGAPALGGPTPPPCPTPLYPAWAFSLMWPHGRLGAHSVDIGTIFVHWSLALQRGMCSPNSSWSLGTGGARAPGWGAA